MHLSSIWFLLLLPVSLLGQNVDSLQDHVEIGIYPSLAYSPETDLSFGVFALIILKNKSGNYSYTPNLISPKIIYTLNNQSILTLDGSFFTEKNSRLDTKIKYSNYLVFVKTFFL